MNFTERDWTHTDEEMSPEARFKTVNILSQYAKRTFNKIENSI